VPRRGFASLQDTDVAKTRAEAAALAFALDEDSVCSFVRREIVGSNVELERAAGEGSEWPGFEAGGRYHAGGGVLGGGARKSRSGLVAKRHQPLLLVEMNFSGRSYVQNIRTRLLCDLDARDRFTIPIKPEDIFAK
jgi:hypothetical protein